MDDLIQVLIFIVTFVIFIVSAVRKQKKQPVKNPDMQDPFETLFGGISQLSDEEELFPKEAPVQTLKKEVKKPMTKPNLPEEGIDAIPNKSVPVNENPEWAGHKSQRFDLREAVIYQTILTRKDF